MFQFSESHARDRASLAVACVACFLSFAHSGVGDTLPDNLISVNTANPSSSTVLGSLNNLSSPLGIVAFNDNVYISDISNNLIQQLNPIVDRVVLSPVNIGITVSSSEGDLAFYDEIANLANALDQSGHSNATTATVYRFNLSAESSTAAVDTPNIPTPDGQQQAGELLYTITPRTGTILPTPDISDACGLSPCYGFAAPNPEPSTTPIAALSNSNSYAHLFQTDSSIDEATERANVHRAQVTGYYQVGVSALPPIKTAKIPRARITVPSPYIIGTLVAPEPSTAALCLFGLPALLAIRRIAKPRAAFRPWS